MYLLSRFLADSNRRTRFCRPLTKPLIQGTGCHHFNLKWGSWRIRTAVHGFADRWLSHSSKEPDLLSLAFLSNALQRYNYFLNLQYLCPKKLQFFSTFFSQRRLHRLPQIAIALNLSWLLYFHVHSPFWGHFHLFLPDCSQSNRNRSLHLFFFSLKGAWKSFLPHTRCSKKQSHR